VAAADDVRLILATSDDVFTAAGISTPCIYNSFDEEVQMDNFGAAKQIIRRAYALVCTDDFPNLKQDDQVTVNQVQYKALSTQRIQDGHMMQVNLQVVRQ
jgi:hypothetical protein